MEIRKMEPEDWPAVRTIYQAGIDTGDATFAAEAPETWVQWSESHLESCSLVAVEDQVVGWAALSPVSDRCVYLGVGEVSVYVAPTAARRGVGSTLLAALIAVSESERLWTLQAGIFPENEASFRLHARHGFRQVGLRKRLGQAQIGPRQGQWRDVLLLERRSEVVGVDG